MDVAFAEQGGFQIAMLVEAEQRMVAGTAEMAVEGAAFLVSVGGTDLGIRIEDQFVGWSSLAHLIDPLARQIHKSP